MVEPTADAPTPDPDADAPPTRLERLAWARDLASDIVSPKTIALAVAVLMIVVTGLLGGWGAATEEAETVPTLAPGEKVTLGPFDVSFRKARWADELKPLAYAEKGVRYYFFPATVTNTSDRALQAPTLTSMLDPALTGRTGFQGRSGFVPDRGVAWRLDNSTLARHLQPGMTYELVFVFKQKNTEPLPAEAAVDITPVVWRTNMVFGGKEWMPDIDGAQHRLVVPVEKYEAP